MFLSLTHTLTMTDNGNNKVEGLGKICIIHFKKNRFWWYSYFPHTNNLFVALHHTWATLSLADAVFCFGVLPRFPSYAPINTRVMRTWAEREKVSVLSHTQKASTFVWCLLLFTFVHMGSFFMFLDKKDLSLLAFFRLLCYLRFPKAGVKLA